MVFVKPLGIHRIGERCACRVDQNLLRRGRSHGERGYQGCINDENLFVIFQPPMISVFCYKQITIPATSLCQGNPLETAV